MGSISITSADEVHYIDQENDVLKQRYGWKPAARIFMQDVDIDGRAGPLVRELKGWTTITINHHLLQHGKAVISFENVGDRYFGAVRLREFVSEEAALTKKYLDVALRRLLPNVKELNPARRYVGSIPEKNGVSNSEITPGMDGRIREYVDFIYELGVGKTKAKYSSKRFDSFSRDRQLLIRDAYDSQSKSKSVFKLDVAEELSRSLSPQDIILNMGVMQRIYVDVLGQDGKWYAGFTGIVTGFSDSFVAGESATVQLICKDYWRLLALNTLSIKQGLHPIEENIVFERQQELSYSNYVRSNIFEGVKGQDIVKEIVDLTQLSLCWDAYVEILTKRNRNDIVTPRELKEVLGYNPQIKLSDKGGVLTVKDFFSREKFLGGVGDYEFTDNEYLGGDHLRVVNEAQIRWRDGGPSLAAQAKKPGEGIDDGDAVGQLTGSILVDKYVREGVQAQVYRRVIDNVLAPYQIQRATGDSILRKVAEATHFDIFFDPNGNLIYQIPKFNNFPGQFRVDFGRKKVNLNTSLSSSVTRTEPVYSQDNEKGTWASGEYDYSPDPDLFAWKGHGFNYAVTDISLIDWNFSFSEESLLTGLRVPAGLDWVTTDEVIGARFLLGLTKLDEVVPNPFGVGNTVRDLQARFGARIQETAQIIIPDIFQYVTRQLSNEILNAFALASLNMLNSQADIGKVKLSNRADFVIGNNVWLVERQKLYYLQGTSMSIRTDGPMETTLDLGFGHDIAHRVTNPWIAIRSLIPDLPELTAFSKSGNKVSVNDSLNMPGYTTAAGGAITGGVPRLPELPNKAPGSGKVTGTTSGRVLRVPQSLTQLFQTFGNPGVRKDLTVSSQTATNSWCSRDPVWESANIMGAHHVIGGKRLYMTYHVKLHPIIKQLVASLNSDKQVTEMFISIGCATPRLGGWGAKDSKGQYIRSIPLVDPSDPSKGFQYQVGTSLGENKYMLYSQFKSSGGMHLMGLAFDVYCRDVKVDPPTISAYELRKKGYYYQGVDSDKAAPWQKLLVPHFEKFGFEWGGYWGGRWNDAMHFQFYQLRRAGKLDDEIALNPEAQSTDV